jgi:hypothetical protein
MQTYNDGIRFCKLDTAGVVVEVWQNFQNGPDSSWKKVERARVLARVQTLPRSHALYNSSAYYVDVEVGSPAPAELLALYCNCG